MTTLWNIIRDFFVQYIFGGQTSNGTNFNANRLGNLYIIENGSVNGNAIASTGKFGFFFDNLGGNYMVGEAHWFMPLGDWLSTTATIITLCAICFFLFLFVRWLFRLTAGLISCRG